MQPQYVTHHPGISVVSQNVANNIEDKFQPSALVQMKGLSIAQIVMGALSFVFGIILIGLEVEEYTTAGLSFVGYGIWIGFYFILVGGIGLGAVRANKSCWIIAAMVLNIVCASLFWVMLLSMSSTGVGYASCSVFGFYSYCDDISRAVVAFNSMLLLIAIAELIVSIWSAVLCCGAVCDCCKGYRGQVLQYCSTNTVPGQQVVVCSTAPTPYVMGPTQVTVQGQYQAYPAQVPQQNTGYAAVPQGPPSYYAAAQNSNQAPAPAGYQQPPPTAYQPSKQ